MMREEFEVASLALSQDVAKVIPDWAGVWALVLLQPDGQCAVMSPSTSLRDALHAVVGAKHDAGYHCGLHDEWHPEKLCPVCEREANDLA